jgi:hypothetical protein
MNVQAHWEHEPATKGDRQWLPDLIATHWMVVAGVRIGVVFESADEVKAGRLGGGAGVGPVRSVGDGKRIVEDQVGAKGKR